MIDATIEKLKTIAALRHVSGALSLTDAIENQAVPLPAAYVLPAAETAFPDRAFGNSLINQIIQVDIAVAIGISTTAIVPAGFVDPVDYLKTAVRDCLVGWTPPGANTFFEFSRYELLGLAPGEAWIQLFFNTQISYRRNVQ
jgi:hypothetical protein